MSDTTWTRIHPILAFAAGVALTGAAAAILGAAQNAPKQGGQGGQGGQGKPADYQIQGPPKPAGGGDNSNTEIKGPPQQGGNAAPQGGYNNSGGMVNSAALQQEASGGVHYHYHFHNDGGQYGYAPAQYVDPNSVAPAVDPRAAYGMGYGPGNPGPMGTASGEQGYAGNPRVFEPVGSQTIGLPGGNNGAGGWGGGWNPFAYGNLGYVDGLND